MRSHRFRKLKVTLIALLFVAFLAVFGFVFMGLWNWLMPALFGWKMINYWQAVGLIVLCRILFGGFRHGGNGYWRHRMRERWGTMTPEEREKMREAFFARWCRVPPPDSKPSA
jgi:hypothetical protein